jgi:hypothetical protein
MKYFLIVLLASLVMPGVAQSNEEMYARLDKAKKYDSEGFKPIDCFAGQARVRGKRNKRESFSIFLPDKNRKCCGTLVRSARTDEHGHFFVEPLAEGEYFAQFRYKGVQQIASFAILKSYDRCGGSDYVEINFSEPNSAHIQESIVVDGDECEENEPRCFRK